MSPADPGVRADLADRPPARLPDQPQQDRLDGAPGRVAVRAGDAAGVVRHPRDQRGREGRAHQGRRLPDDRRHRPGVPDRRRGRRPRRRRRRGRGAGRPPHEHRRRRPAPRRHPGGARRAARPACSRTRSPPRLERQRERASAQPPAGPAPRAILSVPRCPPRRSPRFTALRLDASRRPAESPPPQRCRRRRGRVSGPPERRRPGRVRARSPGAARPGRAEAILAGKVRFQLASVRCEPRRRRRPSGSRAGAVTERAVKEAAQAGARLVLSPRAVLTPMARDRARSLGVEIEKEKPC